ncbi:rCG60263 [Rattus norvegicus]|uniref:RCG60263 n=1 Tax=Rattus norvegicus TaxID=10116 RepID=A6HS06_RAT|nr:rCG60263 [Rattus norvegicus]
MSPPKPCHPCPFILLCIHSSLEPSSDKF